jgi:transposase
MNDGEWAVISPEFPAERELSISGGHPPYSNCEILRAMIYWLGDGIPKRRLREFTGIGYDTLAARLDERIKAGVFLRLWTIALANHDKLCGLRMQLLLIDGAIERSPNGGENTG